MLKHIYRLLGVVTSASLIAGCGSAAGTQNNYQNGNDLVKVISDSALIIDQDDHFGNAKFFIENVSDKTINGIDVFSNTANLNIDATDCNKDIDPHETCEVSYTGALDAAKFQDSASISAVFARSDIKYKSDGVIDILRNPDSAKANFTIVNSRALRNADAEFNIHANGRLNRYQINKITVNGHRIKLSDDAQVKLNGGETLSVLVPADVVNETDPFTSEMKLSIDGIVNSKPLAITQSFMVGVAPTGSIYQPISGYVNPTYSVNISQNGAAQQIYNLNYIESIPAGVVTDNQTHYFAASLMPSPNMTTATAAICANIQAFASGANQCQVVVNGSGGTSAASSTNCSESFTINPTNWPSNISYVQCQYIPVVSDHSGGGYTYPSNGILTINVAKNQNSVSAAIFSDSSQSVATMNVAGLTPPNYANNTSLAFTVNGGATAYRWVNIVNYETTESIVVSYNSNSYSANNSTLTEVPAMVPSVIGAGKLACTQNITLAPYGQPNSSCYTLWAVTTNATAGIAKDMITFTPTFTTTLSGRTSSYTNTLLMQYTNFTVFLANMTTVMGGPNGVPFGESVPETSFVSQAVNGSYGGNSIAQCGTSSNSNTYQCIMQGSYMNVKLPLASSGIGLPGDFKYVLANEAALKASGFIITYALANTANPQTAATTWSTGGCTIPAFSSLTNACYINITNPWSKTNTINSNVSLNVVGYFTSAPNVTITNNWINFYAVKPATKLLPTYQATQESGDDGYWNGGESYGLNFAIGNGSDTNRFFYDTTCTAPVKCLVDRVTGLEWVVAFAAAESQYFTGAGLLDTCNQGGNTSCASLTSKAYFGAQKLINGNNTYNGITATNTVGQGLNSTSQSAYGSYIDWRLPNANELFSLFSYASGPESLVFAIPSGANGVSSLGVNNPYYDTTIAANTSTTWYGGSGNGVQMSYFKFTLNPTSPYKQPNNLSQFWYPLTNNQWMYSNQFGAVISQPSSNVCPSYALLSYYGSSSAWNCGGSNLAGSYSTWLPVRTYTASGFTPLSMLPITNQKSVVNTYSGNNYIAQVMGSGIDGAAWESQAVANGGAVAWPKNGNIPATDTSGATGRFVVDPTGSCYIDLLTGLFYNKAGLFTLNANSNAVSTFKADLANYQNLDTNSGTTVPEILVGSGSVGAPISKHLCGLSNWRAANVNEVMGLWNYYYASWYSGCGSVAGCGNTTWLNKLFNNNYIDQTTSTLYFYASTYQGGNVNSEPAHYMPYFTSGGQLFAAGEYRMTSIPINMVNTWGEFGYHQYGGGQNEIATLVAGGTSRIHP